MFSKIKNLFQKNESPKPKIIVFAGAGLSAESGLATFRNSPDGLWAKHKISEVCDIRTWRQNKELVNKFYSERKKEILATKPNSAHHAIAKLQESLGKDNVIIFTSNIDDLLERSGAEIIHLHGDIYHVHCQECQAVWNIGNNNFTLERRCPECTSLDVKPNIIFFHEHAPKYKEMRYFFENSGVIKDNNLIPNMRLIIGTSFQVLQLESFYLNRGQNFLVDPYPQINGNSHNFQKIYEEVASTGTEKAIADIQKLYANY